MGRVDVLALTLALSTSLLLACTGEAPAPDGAADTSPSATPAQAVEDAAELHGAWEWVSFQGMDDSTLDVGDPSRYTLTLGPEGASMVADCNRGTAGFEVEGGSISFSPIAATEALCPGDSLGETYLRYLNDVRGWMISDGRLHLALMADAGIMEFRPADR